MAELGGELVELAKVGFGLFQTVPCGLSFGLALAEADELLVLLVEVAQELAFAES